MSAENIQKRGSTTGRSVVNLANDVIMKSVAINSAMGGIPGDMFREIGDYATGGKVSQGLKAARRLGAGGGGGKGGKIGGGKGNSNIFGGRKPDSNPFSGGGGGSGSTSGGGSDAVPFNFSSRSLLMEPDNAVVNYSSGLKSGLTVNPNQPRDGGWSPLIISHGSLLSDILPDTALYEYLSVQAYNLINSTLQMNINFRVSLTVDEVINYFKTVIKALQIHYTLDSIRAYATNQSSDNLGMTHLRGRLTADVLNRWGYMIELLETYTIPPAVLQFIRFMYQNHAFTDVPGAPICKLGYGTMLYPTDSTDTITPVINQTITELNNLSAVNSKLRKAFPTSFIGSLPLSSAEVLVDMNFHTFWHNILMVSLGDSNVLYNYTATDSNFKDQRFVYNTCTNELDGTIFATWSIFSALNNRVWGFYEPLVGNQAGVVNPCYTSVTIYDQSKSSKFADMDLSAAGGSMILNPIYVDIGGNFVQDSFPTYHAQLTSGATLNTREQCFAQTLKQFTTWV